MRKKEMKNLIPIKFSYAFGDKFEGANYLQSVFWTLNFAKIYWISMKILSPKILDFYEIFCQNRSPVF